MAVARAGGRLLSCLLYTSNECIHPESQYVVKNKTFADCEQGGYTGDTYCGFCNEKIADGKETEPGGHAEAVIDEKTVKEATCTEEGYTLSLIHI